MNDAMKKVQELGEVDELQQAAEKYDEKTSQICEAVINVTDPELSQQELHAARMRINALKKMMPTLEFLRIQL